MSEVSKVLKNIMDAVGDIDISVSEDEYASWKLYFDGLSEHDKVFNLLGALSQYLISGSSASAAVLMVAMICTERWCKEKDQEEFLNEM